MSAGPVFVAFYPDDWLAGTRGMTAAQTGVYITLTAMMYSRGAPLGMDSAHLARLCGIPAGSFKKVVAALISDGKIIEAEGGLWSRRVDRELAKTSDRSAKASASAKARWTSGERENQTSTMHSGEQQNLRYTAEKPSDNSDAPMRTECGRNANQTQTQTHKVEREVRDAPAALAPTGPRLEDFVSDEAARDYRAHRVAVKFKLTPGAEKGICRELTKICAMGLDPTEALETAAARGWRAVKADWIINDKSKDAGHGQQPRGPQARAEIASDRANDFWAGYDAQESGDPFQSRNHGGAERGPDDGGRDSCDGSGILEGVILRPASFRR
jgi:uncharacterized protein YdaU (DUF1376 family)